MFNNTTTALTTEGSDALDKLFGKNLNDLFGFDHFANFGMVDNPSYPPYNVTKSKDGTEYVISVAVAGLDKNDINVSIQDESKLVISYDSTDSTEEEASDFIHRGIATRAFESRFSLPKDSEVVDCSLTNGMLSVTIRKNADKGGSCRPIPIS